MKKTRGKRRQKKLEEKRLRRVKRIKERREQEMRGNITTVGHVMIGEEEE